MNLNKKTLILGLGQSEQLTTDIDGLVNWVTSDTSVIKTSSNGTVYSYDLGKANVKAKFESEEAICDVTVYGIKFVDDIYKSIAVGQELQVKLVSYPEGIEYELVNNSSDIINLTFDESKTYLTIVGTALGKASFQINSTYKDSSYSQNFEIEVVNEFTPISELTEDVLNSINVSATRSELNLKLQGSKVIYQPEAYNMPELYYKKINDNPMVFEYEIHALSTEIAKYLLKDSSKAPKPESVVEPTESENAETSYVDESGNMYTGTNNSGKNMTVATDGLIELSLGPGYYKIPEYPESVNGVYSLPVEEGQESNLRFSIAVPEGVITDSYDVAFIISDGKKELRWNLEKKSEGEGYDLVNKSNSSYTITDSVFGPNGNCVQNITRYTFFGMPIIGKFKSSLVATPKFKGGEIVTCTVVANVFEKTFFEASTLAWDSGKVGGEALSVDVEGNTISYEGEIEYYPADESLGRTEGNRVGLMVTPAEGMIDAYPDVKIKIGNGIYGKEVFNEYPDYEPKNTLYYYPLVTAIPFDESFTIEWDENHIETFNIKVLEGSSLKSNEDITE